MPLIPVFINTDHLCCWDSSKFSDGLDTLAINNPRIEFWKKNNIK